MKKKFAILVVLFVSISFVTLVFAQTKPEATPGGATEKVEGQTVGSKEAATESPSAPEKPKVRTKPKGIFVGDVISVNPDAMTLTIEQKVGTPGEKGIVTFDINNAQLKGYKEITDIKKGDKVGVKYTKDGIEVKKIKCAKKSK